MAGNAQLHPEQEQLLSFGQGRLGPDEAIEIEKHLDACPDCCETMLELADDTFIALLRKSPPPGTVPNADVTLDLGSGTTPGKRSAGELPRELLEHARYQIAELLGRGGMGDVYKAQHKVMNRPVALKVIKPELVQNNAAIQRFHREVQAAARLHDRNIVTAYDAEQAGELHFLVMEYVDGVNLDEVVRQRGPLPVDEACDYIRQAASGLQHAHELGMVHRDIKPHNLMLTTAGEVKILDFGLANFASELAAEEVIEAGGESSITTTGSIHQLTQMGTMMGTPDFMSPEQAKDAHAADIRADIYSLGCTFYMLLTGRTPFGQRTVLDKIKAHTAERAQPLSAFRDDVSAEVEAILLKMMAKNPAERYQTPAEVGDALRRLIDQLIEEKLRERGLGSEAATAPPGKPLAAVGYDEARDWYDRLAGFMWSVACCNILGGVVGAGLIVAVTTMGRPEDYIDLALHPLTPLTLMSLFAGIPLLAIVPKVRRMESYRWILLAAMLSMMPGFAVPLGLTVGVVTLFYLLRPRYRLPLGARPSFSLADGLAFIAILLFPLSFAAAGGVFYIETEKGLVRVEVADESLAVQINGKTIGMKDGTTPLSIRTGEQKLIVRRGDFEFETDSFQLRRGEQVALKVDFVAGEIVVNKDGERFGAKAVPDNNRTTAPRIVVELKKGGKYFVDGRQVNDAVELMNRLKSIYEVSPDRAVVIQADKEFAFEPVKQLIALVREIGFQEVQVASLDKTTRHDEIALVAEFAGHTNVVRAVRFLPGNEQIVSVDGNGNVILWDTKTHSRVRRFKIPGETYSDADISADGRLLAVGSDWGTTKGRLEIWDIAEGKVLHRMTHRFDNIEQMRFSPNGGKLVAVGAPPVALLWDVATGKEFPAFDPGFAGNQLKSAAFSVDERLVALGCVGRIYLFDVESGSVKREIALPSDHNVLDLVSSRSRRELAAIQGSGPVAVIDTKSWTVAQTIPSTSGGVLRSGAFVNDDLLVTSSDDGVLQLRNLDGTVRATADCGAGSCLHVSVSSDGRHVVTGGGWVYDRVTRNWTVTSDFKLRLWELPKDDVPAAEPATPQAELTLVRHFQGAHVGPIIRMAVSPDGKLIVSGGSDGTARVWDVATGNEKQPLLGHKGEVKIVAFSPDGGQILTGDGAGTVRLWNAAGELTETYLPPDEKAWVSSIAFSPVRALAAVAHIDYSKRQNVRISLLEPGKPGFVRRLEGPPDPSAEPTHRIWSVAFSPDGKRLYAGGEFHLLGEWDVETGACTRKFRGVPSHPYAMALSIDERYLVTGQSKDNTALLWDVTAGQTIRRFVGHTGSINAVAFSPDGRFVATGSGGRYGTSGYEASTDNSIRIWEVQTGTPLAMTKMEERVCDLKFSPDGNHLFSAGGEPASKGSTDLRMWQLPESLRGQRETEME